MTAMDSRSDILSRIRGRLGRNVENGVAARDRIDTILQAKAAGPRPGTNRNTIAFFIEKSLQMSSTVDRVASLAEVPGAVGRYADQFKLLRRGVCWPQLAGLDWVAAGVGMEARPAVDADLLGVTGCFCAIAETGTLMLCSSADTPATTSLLPETHVAVVPASRIVAGMEEAWNLARGELGELPRAVNFISGPSRTGDIEQTIVIGAHGPYRVHIVIVG
jgi:L-lactate dehydrogenase complex protein LldG